MFVAVMIIIIILQIIFATWGGTAFKVANDPPIGIVHWAIAIAFGIA